MLWFLSPSKLLSVFSTNRKWSSLIWGAFYYHHGRPGSLDTLCYDQVEPATYSCGSCLWYSEHAVFFSYYHHLKCTFQWRSMSGLTLSPSSTSISSSLSQTRWSKSLPADPDWGCSIAWREAWHPGTSSFKVVVTCGWTFCLCSAAGFSHISSDQRFCSSSSSHLAS